jgi:ABC-type transport system involved in multi-copper enzyme maturation permease subunit
MRRPLRFGPGPVFVHEAIASTRRWSFFAMRALFVLALLAGLGLVWLIHTQGVAGRRGVSLNELAELGEWFYYAIATVQLTLVLLVAPVATADAICLDRARGNLTHMLVTDLSSAEIVLGKLAARVAAVLGLVVATIPVLALAGLLGGILLEAIATLSAITLALAALGCSLALAFSVGAKKTHDVLMTVYAIEGVWVLGPLLWSLFQGLGGMPILPQWCWEINPYMLVWAPYFAPNVPIRWLLAGVVGGMFAGSAALVAWAVLRIRAVERRRDGVRTSQRAGRLSRGLRWLGARRRQPSLDDNPVLWREWRSGRPSRPARLVWGLFFALALLGTAWGIVLIFDGDNMGLGFLALANVIELTLGLLLVSITAPTVLTEERVRGSLDVLLASPLETERIVLAKWWGAYRRVPALVLLPAIGMLFFALAAPDKQWSQIASEPMIDPPTTFDRIAVATFPVVLFLVQGAVVVSVGLALATWTRRAGRAVAVSVAGYAAVALGWVVLVFSGLAPEILMAMGLVDRADANSESVETFLVSFCPIGTQMGPLMSAFEPTVEGRYAGYLGQLVVLLAMLGFALSVLGLTLATFNRCVGRVPERRRRADGGRAFNLRLVLSRRKRQLAVNAAIGAVID